MLGGDAYVQKRSGKEKNEKNDGSGLISRETPYTHSPFQHDVLPVIRVTVMFKNIAKHVRGKNLKNPETLSKADQYLQ